MSYDDLIRKVHGARFQMKMFIVFFINGIPNACMITSLALILYTPVKHQCNLPPDVWKLIKNNTLDINNTLKYLIPLDEDGERSQCRLYERSADDVALFLRNMTYGEYKQNSTMNISTIPCDYGHNFENSFGINSVSMEFGWTCEKASIKPLVSTAFMLGVTGASLSGFLSDRFGRRLIFNIFTIFMFFAMFIQSFSTSTLVYAILLFLSGLVSMVNYIVGFVLGAEITIPEKRNFLCISSFISFSCGYAISSLIFFLTPDWRWYLRACAMLGIVFMSNYWLIPESPRWLMAKGRIEEAKEVLKKIAKFNNKPDDLINKMLDTVEKEAELLAEEKLQQTKTNNVTTAVKIVKEIIKTPAMMKILLVSEFSWFSVAVVYYGLALSVQSLSGDIFVNCTVMGFMEMPGYALAYLAVKYMSRPKSHGGLMIASGVFCMGAALLNKISGQASTIAGLIGKSFNAGAFYLVYIHTTEVFPTLARNSCMSLGSFAGRIGSMISPYISYMVDLYGFYTPYILMSTICVASGLLTLLFFPETRNVELPETVDDTLQLKTLYTSCKKERKGKSKKDISPPILQAKSDFCEV